METESPLQTAAPFPLLKRLARRNLARLACRLSERPPTDARRTLHDIDRLMSRCGRQRTLR